MTDFTQTTDDRIQDRAAAEARAMPQSTRRAVVELGELNGLDGFTLVGERSGDQAGWSVSAAGDVNGDGIADIIVGAPEYSPNSSYYYTDPGAAYVVYGSSAGFATNFDLGDLNGTNGFRVTDASHYNGYYHSNYRDDGIGSSVSALGDINGDGVDDIAIGARDTELAGAVHVVFGSTGQRSSSMNASSMDAATGFTIVGESAYDHVGYEVSSAGDVNGDGVSDILIGAYGQDTGGNSAGSAYVVFGRASGFVRTLNLADLNGTNGFALDGDRYDDAGRSVAAAGDVNGDGIDDLIVGANGAGSGGAAYVLYGTTAANDARRDLSSLSTAEGVTITGASSGDDAGWSVAGVGDVNGDGVDDVLVGARYADDGAYNAGAAYVVFGGTALSDLNVSALDGTNGFTLVGADTSDYAGFSVAAAGDFNGDGHADIAIGAYAADPNSTSSGEAYVVFGSDRGFAASIDLGDLDGSDGVVLRGGAYYDYAGRDVSSAGDVNDDGYDDLIVGAHEAGGAGEAYVVYGFASNVGPTPQDDAITVSADEAWSGSLFADNGEGADADADGDVLSVSQVAGDAANVGTILTLASGARLTVEADGAVRFDADDAHVALSVGETAAETFTYTVSDGLGGTGVATAIITITGVNDAPQAAGESVEAVEDDGPVAVDVLSNDTDVDANDALFVQSVSGGTGTATLTDGIVTYAAEGAFEALAVGTTALDTFSYVIADGHGGTDTGTVTVQVTGVNDAPEIGAIAFSLGADGGATFDVRALATDVDDGAVLRYAVAEAANGAARMSDGQLTFAANGAWDALALGQTAEAVLDVTVTDEHGASATTAALATVIGVNDAPTALALDLIVGEDEGAVTSDLRAAVSDVDDGAILTIALADAGPVGATLSADGVLSFAPGDAFAALAEGTSATRAVAYTVTDEHGASADAVATLTVTGANDAPTAAGAALAVTEGTQGRLDLTALIADIDEGAALSVALDEDAPASLEDGALLFAAGAAFDALAAGETSTRNVSYTVTDEHGATANAQIAVTVTGVNDDPELVGTPGAITYTENERAYAALASGIVFFDVDTEDFGGAAITARVAGGADDWMLGLAPGGYEVTDGAVQDGDRNVAEMAADGATLTLRLLAGTDAGDVQGLLRALAFLSEGGDDPQAASGQITVTVTDGAADDIGAPEGTVDGTAGFTLALNVEAANDAPVATDDAEVALEKARLVFDPRTNDTDPEDDDLSITAIDGQAATAGDIVVLASGATVTLMADGRLTYDPGEAFYGLTAEETGTDGFTYEVTDAGGAASIGQVSLTIQGADGGLVWTGTAADDTHGGTADADSLDGAGGDDVLMGGDGADSLMGGAGDDVLYGDGGPDAMIAAMAALAEAGLI